MDFNANLGNSYVYENDGSPTGTDGFYYDGSGSDDGVEGGGT